MKIHLRASFFIAALGVYVACAPARFESNQDCGSGCVSVKGTPQYSYSIVPMAGKVDILFVDDNSGSMSTEQNAIAARFSSFLASLDSKKVDYRIAITTTDVSNAQNGPRAINKFGALQDGKLIEFSSGTFFLTPSTANRETLFSNTIRRQETLQCENFLNLNTTVSQTSSAYLDNCPSPDERGIMAANMTLANNPSGFVRSDAKLAIVFITDEDVRSQLYDKSAGFALSSDDLPQALISRAKGLSAGKDVMVHAIVVNPGNLRSGATAAQVADAISKITFSSYQNPGSISVADFYQNSDSACLNTQSTQTNGVLGSYGYLYSLAAQMTGGVIGSVCASDYGSQLSSIGNVIGDSIYEHQLRCVNPQSVDGVTPIVTIVPAAGNAYTVVGDKVRFNPNLQFGTVAQLNYKCP